MIVKLIRNILVAVAILPIVSYLVLVYIRIQYPFQLEWMEGGSLSQVKRIIDGQKLYVSPSLEFIPFIYPPFYFYVSAIIAKVTGISFIPLRLTSIIASLCCFFAVFQVVTNETKNKIFGVIAVGLFAATYRISGAWFDLGRVDTLFLALFLLSFYLIKFHSSKIAYFIAGILIVLSFHTKQTASVLSLPLIIYSFLLGPKRSIYFIGTIFITGGASVLFMELIHNGWYSYYILILPLQQATAKNMYIGFWTQDIFSPLALACVISFFYLTEKFFSAENTLSLKFVSLNKEFIFYIILLFGMMAAAWKSRLHSGGYNNGLFPAYAIISILFGIGLDTLVKQVTRKNLKDLEVFIYLICIVQFSYLAYNPWEQLPTSQDLEIGNKFIDELSQVEGDIFIPHHNYLLILIDKNSVAHSMAIRDILSNDQGELRHRLIVEIVQAIEQKRFKVIILDNTMFEDWAFSWLIQEIESNYIKYEKIFKDEKLFWPVTGYLTRPDSVYIPAK